MAVVDRVDVHEGKGFLVLPYFERGNLAANDLAENAILLHNASSAMVKSCQYIGCTWPEQSA
jgi:hypothetical protein